MKIVNPLSPSLAEEDIKTVLYALAGQGGCDGEPYDQIQQAADYIAELEALVEKLKCCGNCKHEPEFFSDNSCCVICVNLDKWEAK